MSRLYFMTDGGEMVRRRALVPKGSIVEAWPDIAVGGGTFWVGEDSKTLLDAAGEARMPVKLSVPAEIVPVFYGPQLCDLESLPREESLRARVLSAHGVAVAWVTLNPMGERASHEPKSLDEPTFHLRRPGGGAGHLWRLFPTKADAVAFMERTYGTISEGADWARALPADDFDALIKRHGA
jgi:hypothetical protein